MAEIVDKATILRLKTERIKNTVKAAVAQTELDSMVVPVTGPFETMLYHVNSVLWDVEDRLRVMEAENDFGSEFVLLARSVYFINDLRAQVKARISNIIGEELKEVKSYVN
jgi:hypothetical protein